MTVASRTLRTSVRRALAAGALTALSACGSELGVPEPATEQGESVVDLWRALLVAATVLGLVVLVLATIAVVRYRRRNGDDTLPPQRHGSGILEAVYVAIPLGVVIGFFAYTVRIDQVVTEPAEDPDVVVDVTGYRWGWRFEYPQEGVVIESIAGEVPELVLPAGADVRLHLESDDVIHSFFVPEFLTKRDLIPGNRSALDLTLTRTGEFLGHCAEFCGLDHARMNFTVSIVPTDEYDRWLAERQAAA